MCRGMVVSYLLTMGLLGGRVTTHSDKDHSCLLRYSPATPVEASHLGCNRLCPLSQATQSFDIFSPPEDELSDPS
jgi:hypothetical protein